MLDKLENSVFFPHLGKVCLLSCGELVLETLLDTVEEKPLARHPLAPKDGRTPFTLIFRGNPDCPWGDGVYAIKIPGMEEIPGVYLNRILNIRPEPASLFQAVFN